MTKDRGPDEVLTLVEALKRSVHGTLIRRNPPVPEIPCCTVQSCCGIERAKQGEGCPACPSRPKEER